MKFSDTRVGRSNRMGIEESIGLYIRKFHKFHGFCHIPFPAVLAFPKKMIEVQYALELLSISSFEAFGCGQASGIFVWVKWVLNVGFVKAVLSISFYPFTQVHCPYLLGGLLKRGPLGITLTIPEFKFLNSRCPTLALFLCTLTASSSCPAIDALLATCSLGSNFLSLLLSRFISGGFAAAQLTPLHGGTRGISRTGQNSLQSLVAFHFT